MHSARLIRNRRRGATTVETAVVLLPLFLIVFASIEFERALMAKHAMEEAARAGCRVAILKSTSIDDISDEIDPIMESAGIDQFTITTDPSNIAAAERWDPVSVSIQVQYANVSWVPSPQFLASKVLTASCTLPKEYEKE